MQGISHRSHTRYSILNPVSFRQKLFAAPNSESLRAWDYCRSAQTHQLFYASFLMGTKHQNIEGLMNYLGLINELQSEENAYMLPPKPIKELAASARTASLTRNPGVIITSCSNKLLRRRRQNVATQDGSCGYLQGCHFQFVYRRNAEV